MQRIKPILALIFALAFIQASVFASEECPDCGTVSGTINVWKTKVKAKGPKSGTEVVVFLEDKSGKTYPPVDKHVQMDQRSLIFIPHVLPIQKGTTVKFLNNDTVEHNVYFLFEETGKTLNIGTWTQGVSVTHTFDETGAVIVLCKLHLEMAAHVVVLDNAYFNTAVFDRASQQASYMLKNIPPGNYILKTWHKKLKMKEKQAEITVESGKTTEYDITITKAKYAK
jgi:plastocyanin